MVNLESQLVDVLDHVIKAQETKNRNINLIAHFYGLRGASWPTLEQTARSFGISTRERARQIIARDFKNMVKASDLPALGNLYELIAQREFWFYSDLESRISDCGMAGSKFSIPGLFSLMSVVGLSNEYKTYSLGSRSTGLQPANRGAFDISSTSYITKPGIVDEFNPILRQVRTLPGQYGIANLEYLKDGLSDNQYAYFLPLIVSVLEHHPFAWSREVDGQAWYMFEDRDNVLINYCEKVFTAFEECETQRLADALRNALDARSQKNAFPSENLIYEWLTSSTYFDCNGAAIRFNDEPETQLRDIDKKIVQYLREQGSTDFRTIREFLSSGKFSQSLIVKAVTRSPLVSVDDSLSRRRYRYSLVAEPVTKHDRYETYRRRLGKLAHTDLPAEEVTRSEQPLLRDWLFEEKQYENCAACDKTFSKEALVAAHKKPRSECNEAERRDPYIVMPLCKFGCDYLYEYGHIFVSDGVLTKGVLLKRQGREGAYLEKLVGRKLDARWLLGDPSYFRGPTTGVDTQ